MSDRWETLREFTRLIYAEPLPLLDPVQEEPGIPLALSEWKTLTANRYAAGESFDFVSISPVDPAHAMEGSEPVPGFPEQWLGIVENVSGHSLYFVDPGDPSPDPPVFYWDDESPSDPAPEFASLSGLLTWLVVKESLDQLGDDEGPGALGAFGEDVRSCAATPEDPVRHLSYRPWPSLQGLELHVSEDGQVLRHGSQFVVLRRALWKPIVERFEAKVAAEAAEAKRAQEAAQARRAAKTTTKLKSQGTGLSRPEGLLTALHAIEDRLGTLDRMFLQDFKMRVAAGSVPDGLRLKAAKVLAKHSSR